MISLFCLIYFNAFTKIGLPKQLNFFMYITLHLIEYMPLVLTIKCCARKKNASNFQRLTYEHLAFEESCFMWNQCQIQFCLNFIVILTLISVSFPCDKECFVDFIIL